MKENSIEEDIKILEKKIEDYKPYKNIEYCSHAGQILQEEYKALEHILSDYKRVLKENEELKEDRDKFKKALGRRITYCNELEKDLFENSSNYVIPKQIVKDKIEELLKKLDNPNNDRWEKNDDIYYSQIKAQIRILKELLGKE